MNAWEAVFSRSRVNAGYYDEERLPQNRWEWPRGTWFQSRRDISAKIDFSRGRKFKAPISDEGPAGANIHEILNSL